MKHSQYMKKGILIVILAGILSAALLGCTPSQEHQPDLLTHWCGERAAAINSLDADLYLSTVNKENIFLYNEEYNLIDSLDEEYAWDFKLVYSDVEKIDEHKIRATIMQSYDSKDGRRNCQYQAVFMKKNDQMLYDGPDQPLMEEDSIKISYPENLEKFAAFIDHVSKQYLIDAKEEIGYEPDRPLSFKIYNDHEVFLQSVKLDLPDWVGGWHEYGESVKIYTRTNSTYAYDTMVNHECTHRLLSDITSDNASYWLQEGLATLLQRDGPLSIHKLKFYESDAIDTLKNKNKLWAFEDFTKVNLELLDADDEVTGYYAVAAACTLYFIDYLGVDAFFEAVKTLSSQPYIQCTAAEKLDITNARTIAMLVNVTGMDEAALYESLDQWLDSGGYNR